MSSNEDYLEDLLKSMGEEDGEVMGTSENSSTLDANLNMDDLNLEELLDLIDDDDLNEINDLLKEPSSELPETTGEFEPTVEEPVFEGLDLDETSTEDTMDLFSMLGLENEVAEETEDEQDEAVEIQEDLFELESIDETIDESSNLFGLEDLEETPEPKEASEDDLNMQQESMDLLQDLMGLDEGIFADATTDVAEEASGFDFLEDNTELLDMVEPEPIKVETEIKDRLTEVGPRKKESFWVWLYHFLFTAKEVEELEELPIEEDKKASKKGAKKSGKGKDKAKDSSTNEEDDEETKELTEEEKKKAEKAAKKEAKKKEKEAKKQMKLAEVEEISELYTKKNISRIVVICMSILVMIIILFLVLEKMSFNRLAEDAYNKKEYTTAYGILYGKDLNESQNIIYERSSMILLITNKYDLYESYLRNGETNLAVDALIEGVEMYDALAEDIAEYHTTEEMQEALNQIEEALDTYGISLEKARTLMQIESNTEYEEEISNLLK